MPRHRRYTPVTDAMREAIILSWHDAIPVDEIACKHGIDSRTVYAVWKRAKTLGILPYSIRAYMQPDTHIIDHDITIGPKDRLLERLQAHHSPGHGELRLRNG